MKAALRLGIALAAAALAFGPATALAQALPQATTNTSAPTAIGPKELQNFSINGTVTQRSDAPAQVPAATRPRATGNQAQAAPGASQPAASTLAQVPATESADQARRTARASADAGDRPTRSAPEPQHAPVSTASAALPELRVSTGTTAAAPLPAAAAPGFAADSPEPPQQSLAPERGFGLLPWLLAALVLGAGGAFLFWRNRPREALAGGPQVDAYVAPAPRPVPRAAPAPTPAPTSPKAAPPSIPGVVSTRLRPWVEIGFHPLRCIIDNEKAAIEFEIELFNSGSAPARGVLVEANLFNAGPVQDQQIGAFFDKPVGQGERIAAIQPLKRVAIKTQVAIGRDQVQAYELGGRQVFVPLIAFNALYSWSAGEGQTSVSYLLGLDTKGEKLGPFRLDLGPRLFRSVAARLLPAAVRA